MLKIRISKIMSAVISCVMFMALFIPQNSMKTLAICCRKDGFDKSRYTLTGNMAEDVATIAKSQKGRFCDDFGYTGVDWGAWCDEFVADCIENAGGDSSIVAHGGTVADFANKMMQRGAVRVTTPQTGDLVFFTYSHVEIVTKVVNGVVYSAGGNNNDPNTNTYHNGGCCAGEHRTYDISYYLRPAYANANAHPIGYLDSYGTDGRNVNVSGWTYDPSSPSSQLAVHIYLRDGGGGMHCIGALTADQVRSDVNDVYGCGDYHGYEGSGSAVGLAAGEYTVQVAYLDVEDGGNGATWVSGGMVTINPDSEGPSISDVKIIDISKDGYTVQCTVEDSSGVSNVRFPTWTEYNDQDDIIWGDGTASGNVWSYRVNITDHNDEYGVYITHIYAYDKAGNQNAVGTSAYLEDTPPTISDIKIINQTSTSYTVQCKVEDSGSGIDRVQFPTWTSENDQDDIAENWGINEKVRGSLNEGIATFTVNSSEHNNELGIYNTHIYAYDKCGNYDAVGITVNLGVYKLSVDPNGGIYDNSASLVTKEHILKYGYSYWGNIGEGEYGNACRNGYILTGYFDKPSGGTKVYDSKGVAMNTEYFTNLTFFGDCDLTVYAQWEVIKGDINADNSFNVADIVLLQKWLLAVPNTEFANWQAADLCEDGRLDVFDLCLMKRMLVENS